jgi:hypothetical protein
MKYYFEALFRYVVDKNKMVFFNSDLITIRKLLKLCNKYQIGYCLEYTGTCIIFPKKIGKIIWLARLNNTKVDAINELVTFRESKVIRQCSPDWVVFSKVGMKLKVRVLY